MANEDVLLTAALDPTQVERALEQIERRVEQMVASTNRKMQIMGAATKQVAILTQTLVKEFNAANEASLSVDQKKAFVKLQKDITGVADGMDGLIKLMRDMEDIDVSIVQGQLPRSMFRDLIEKEIAKIDASLLERKLGAMMDSANEHLAVRAKALRDDLVKLMGDATLGGKELAAQVKIIEGNIDDLADKLGGVPTTLALGRQEAQDTRFRQLGELEGKDLQDRLYRAIKQTEGGVTDLEKAVNVSATNIREDLVSAMEDPALSGKELRAEVARLTKEFEEASAELRSLQQTAATGVGEGFAGTQATQGRLVADIIGRTEVGELDNQLQRLMQSSEDEVREGALRIKAQLDGMMQLPPEGAEFRKELKRLRDDANALEGIKPLDIITAEEAAQARAMTTAVDQLNKAAYEARQVVSQSAQENIRKEQELGNAFFEAGEKGRISAKAAEDGINRATRAIRLQATVYGEVSDQASELDTRLAKIFTGVESRTLVDQVQRMMNSSVAAVRDGADTIQKRLDEAFSTTSTPEELLAIIRELQKDANKLESIKPLELVTQDQLAAQRQLEQAVSRFNVIAGEAADRGTQATRDLIDDEYELVNAYEAAGNAGVISHERAASAINAATGRVRAGFAVYGEARTKFDELGEKLAEVFASADTQTLQQQIQRLMQSSEERVVYGATIIQDRLNAAFSETDNAEEYLVIMKELQAEANKLDSFKPADVVSAEQAKRASDLQIALRELDIVAAETSQNVTVTGREQIRIQQEAAQAAKENATETESGQKRAITAVKASTAAVRSIGRAYRDNIADVNALAEAQEEAAERADAFAPTEALISAKKASNEYADSMKDISVLQKSSKAEVRELANELDRVGKEAKESFDKGETEAADFERSVNRLKNAARGVADAYGEDVPSASNRASVSLWKLGNVADRVGFRGAGGATQLIDALKGIPIAAVAGVVALAAVAAAVVKITQALIEMGKKAAQAFAEFTKGAVESAKAVQVTDRQLGGFLRAPELGEGYRKLLQDLSFDVGLDLTKDFSRVIVPLAKDLDEVERAAEIAGTLAHAFQETDEAIANAIKQAAGGHFRPLIERFGLTEFEVERIREAQKVSGEFTGVLEGLSAALEFRGLDITTLSGTLQFIQGQMEVVRKQVEITFGEPVRDALSEQFQKLFDIVEDRKGPLMDFFEGLGETVGGIIDSIGDVLVGFADDISDDDIVDFETAIKELGAEIEEVIERLGEIFSTEDRSLVDVAIDLTEALNEVATYLEEILILIREIKGVGKIEVPGVGSVGLKTRVLPFDVGLITSATGLAANAVDISEGAEPNLERIDSLLLSIGSRIPIIGPAINVLDQMGVSILNTADASDAAAAAADAHTEALGDNADELADLIDEQQKYAAELQDLEQLQLEAAKAQEKITEAEGKLARERSMREEEIRTRFARQDIEAEVKRSEKREDLFEQHMRRMLQLTDKYNSDIDKAELDFDRKGEDNERKYQDKLEDIAQDTTDKKIDIEKKYRERLRDIRAKFDLDAEEAIRRNDAVALLRIRRRMKLELETAKQNRDDQVKEADDVEKEKRDNAKKWLERQERDLEITEQRKLDDLRAADDERRQQLIDQYIWEYQQIDKQYDRQKQARAEKLDQAIEDMNKQFDVREEEMAKSLEAEYEIVKKWKDKETDYMRLKLKEQANLVQQQYQLWRTEGSLFSQFMSGHVLSPQNFNPLSPVGPTGIGSRLTPEENPFTPTGGIGGRRYGGYTSTGNVYGINERGPEPFYATRAGIVASRDSLMMSPHGYARSVQIDNSRSVQAGDIYAMDPEKMSPIDRTLMAHMFTEQLLAHGL